MVNYNEIPTGPLMSRSTSTRPPRSLCNCTLLTWLWIWLPGMMHFERQFPAPSINSIKEEKSNGTVLWHLEHLTSSVQSLSRVRLFATPCTPGLPVRHQLPELTQSHVRWVGDAIQPSHPLSSPPPLAFNLSQHQGLFQWVSSSHQVATLDQRPPLTQSPSMIVCTIYVWVFKFEIILGLATLFKAHSVDSPWQNAPLWVAR